MPAEPSLVAQFSIDDTAVLRPASKKNPRLLNMWSVPTVSRYEAIYLVRDRVDEAGDLLLCQLIRPFPSVARLTPRVLYSRFSQKPAAASPHKLQR